jgi:hypothetical protein
MNWFDNYVMKNDNGYLVSEFGGLFVDAGGGFVRHVKGNVNPVNLKEITKGEFLNKLIYSGEGVANS